MDNSGTLNLRDIRGFPRTSIKRQQVMLPGCLPFLSGGGRMGSILRTHDKSA
jgi:hypothetical protein